MTDYWATYHPYAILFVGACMIAPLVWALVGLIRDGRRAKRASIHKQQNGDTDA